MRAREGMGWKGFEWRLWTWFCAPSVSLVTVQQVLKKDIVRLWQKLQTGVSMWMLFFVIRPDDQLKVSGFPKRVFDLKPEEAWEAVGLATSSVRAWKKFGSQDFQVWDGSRGVACKRFPERIQMASVKGTGHHGSVNRKLHSRTVAWVDGRVKESEKNHVRVWEQECYTVFLFVLWCQLKSGFVLPRILRCLQRGSGVSH